MVAQSPPLHTERLWDTSAKQIRSGGGLTLIELMVAMAVVAIATFARIKL